MQAGYHVFIIYVAINMKPLYNFRIFYPTYDCTVESRVEYLTAADSVE